MKVKGIYFLNAKYDHKYVCNCFVEFIGNAKNSMLKGVQNTHSGLLSFLEKLNPRPKLH